MTDTPEDFNDEEMARRVRIVTIVLLSITLGGIALSALTLKADQVNQLPRAPVTPADTNSAHQD